MRDSILPVTLIAFGAVWLFFNLDWVPNFDWVIVLVLAGSGIGILAVEGITRKSIVGGPLLITMGVAWFLHFYYYVQWRYLAPCLIIVLGALLLAARAPGLPERRGASLTARPGNLPPDAP